MLGEDITQAREWVAEVLGDLAVDNENDARLRETLLVLMSSDGSYKLAAERLNLHSNTVKYLVGRAVARRGRASAPTGWTWNWPCCCATGTAARLPSSAPGSNRRPG